MLWRGGWSWGCLYGGWDTSEEGLSWRCPMMVGDTSEEKAE